MRLTVFNDGANVKSRVDRLMLSAVSRVEPIVQQMLTRQFDLVGHHLRLRTVHAPSPKPDYDDGWVLALLASSHRFFDIGCNVGHFALLAALDPGREVVAVDPNVDALAVAAEAVCRNGLSGRARFVPAFVGDVDGDKLDFWTVGLGAAGSRYPTHAVTAASRGDVRQVSTITLDTLARRTCVTPDLVKVDVEGAESEVLAGAIETGRRHETRFLVEMHSSAQPMLENAELVLEWCEAQGYDAYYLRDHVRLEHPSQLADRGRCHLLLQPGGWDYPAGLELIPQSCSVERAVALLGSVAGGDLVT